jgi:hypothetical protein
MRRSGSAGKVRRERSRVNRAGGGGVDAHIGTARTSTAVVVTAAAAIAGRTGVGPHLEGWRSAV